LFYQGAIDRDNYVLQWITGTSNLALSLTREERCFMQLYMQYSLRVPTMCSPIGIK